MAQPSFSDLSLPDINIYSEKRIITSSHVGFVISFSLDALKVGFKEALILFVGRQGKCYCLDYCKYCMSLDKCIFVCDNHVHILGLRERS